MLLLNMISMFKYLVFGRLILGNVDLKVCWGLLKDVFYKSKRKF